MCHMTTWFAFLDFYQVKNRKCQDFEMLENSLYMSSYSQLHVKRLLLCGMFYLWKRKNYILYVRERTTHYIFFSPFLGSFFLRVPSSKRLTNTRVRDYSIKMTLKLGHLRVSPGLCIQTRLSAHAAFDMEMIFLFKLK